MHTVNERAKKIIKLILNEKGRKYNFANAKFAY